MRWALDRRLAIGIGLGSVLLLKMVLLEPASFAVLGLEFTIVAALLPIALLLGPAGIPLIAVACGMAHWVNHRDFQDALLAALAVAIATETGRRALGLAHEAVAWIMAGWSLTFVLAAAMASGHALIAGEDPLSGFLTVLSRTWLPINLVGAPLAAMAGHLGLRLVTPGRPEGATGRSV